MNEAKPESPNDAKPECTAQS